MQGQIYKTYQYTLAAGERVAINRLGTFVSCLAATTGFEIQLDNGDLGEFEAGLTYDAPENKIFRSVALVNTSGASNVIKLAIGFGRVTDSRLTLGAGAVVQEKVPDIWDEGNTQIVAAAAAGDTVLPANPLRREAIITNHDLVNPVWIKASSGGPKRGVYLGPLQTFVLHTQGQLFVHNPHATLSVEISKSETAWSP